MGESKPKLLMTPLVIISAFVSLVEITLTVGIVQTSGSVQLILTWFAVLFPVLIAIGFFVLLWSKPYHLYAPTEYSQSGSASEFISAIRQDRQLSDELKTISGEHVESKTEQLLLSGLLNTQQKIFVLEKMVEWVLSNNTAFVKNLTSEMMDKIRADASDYKNGLKEGFEEAKADLRKK